MKVSLIATVLDAEEHVGAFLASIAAQTRAPDEIVIVDGGSTDGTLAALRAADGVTVLEEPGATIARGRNLAIAHAAHDVIAVADADCAYGPGWLAALLAPLEAGADVAMGCDGTDRRIPPRRVRRVAQQLNSTRRRSIRRRSCPARAASRSGGTRSTRSAAIRSGFRSARTCG